MTTISTMNIVTRIWANLIWLAAIIVLLTFGIGGDEWGTGVVLSVPLFIWSQYLTFKANHTAVIITENRDV